MLFSASLRRRALCAALLLSSNGLLASQQQPSAHSAISAEALYSVRFADPGAFDLLRDSGRHQELAEGSATARSWLRSEVGRAALEQPLAAVDARLDLRRQQVEQIVGSPKSEVLRLRATRPGFVLRMSESEAAQLADAPGVVSVAQERHLPWTTENGPRWIGADQIWNGAATGVPNEGEGVVVGIIDSGIYFGHPSFSDNPADGHNFTNPLGSGMYAGWCDPGHPDYSPAYACNDKLIGAWDYMDAICAQPGSNCTEDDGPADQHGHGTHVASLAVGNAVLLNGSNVEITGVAPHANLIAYDTCTRNASFNDICSFLAIQAAIDRAILDGVDVLNVSILGGLDPWSDDDRDLLDAVDAGIFVAASAGNDGPAAGTVAHRGPWLASVGSTSHDRLKYSGTATFSEGANTLDLEGGTINASAFGPFDLVFGADFGSMDDDAAACGDTFPTVAANPFPPGTWTNNEIVVCELIQGSASSNITYKSKNLQEAGAGGMILVGFNEPNLGFPTLIPSLVLAQAEEDALLAWLAGVSNPQVTLPAGTRVDSGAVADRVATSSSRGPNPSSDVLKPDFVAPGTSIRLDPTLATTGILGAEAPTILQPDFGGTLVIYQSGTSMSSPHVAGAAALLRSLHPTWSPDQIRSALSSTTVNSGLFQQDGVGTADALDYGAGRIDLSAAARATLLLEETSANYLAADPDSGGDPKTLNVASFMHSACAGECSFERTFENVGASPTTWQIRLEDAPAGLVLSPSPGALTLAAGASGTVTFDLFNQEAALLGNWQQGRVVLDPDDGSLPTSVLPLLVQPTAVSTVLIFADGFETGDTTAWSNSTP